MIYAYVCDCGAKAEAQRSVANRKRGPRHCGKVMTLEITGGQLIIKPFEPYRAIGRGRPQINSRQEHRDYLRHNGYEEVGNDRSMAPPELFMHADDLTAKEERQKRELRESCADLAHIPGDLAPPG